MRRSARDHRRMSGTLAVLALITLLQVAGCDEDDPVTVVDNQPPAVPTGVTSVTGDGVVTVLWNDLDEADLVGYDIYRHDGIDPEYGPYYRIGTVGWDENWLDDGLTHWFDDFDVSNGSTYYYAVLAYDESGNESNLSYETVPDTPRPQGEDAWLYDRLGPLGEASGFDFGDLSSDALPWNDPDTDIYVEYDGNGVPWVVAADHALIQDWGTIGLAWVDYAPRDGYSAAGRAELILGHSYIVQIGQNGIHFAKFAVMQITPDGVKIDWAYQIDENNPELGVTDPRPAVSGSRPEMVRL